LGVNIYLMTMISRVPRQIVSFAVDITRKQSTIQEMVDSVPCANVYHTDGYYGYTNIIFDGYHNQNCHNKNDTHNVESINADLRHYLACLHRKSKCFFRSLDTFKAVLTIFVNAYNKFGDAKLNFINKYKPSTSKKIEWKFSILDFLFI